MLRKLIAPAVLAGALVASSAGAQAWNYPALQAPTVSREYNFVVADGDAFGTSFVFQWRNPTGARSQLSFDGGMADTDAETYFMLGAAYSYQLARSRRDMPVDVLLTAGLNGAFGDPSNFYRIPVGVSVGHRFPLEGRIAITPYAHPRLAIDHCADCTVDETQIGVAFDLGADVEFSPQLAMRVAAGFGGSDFFTDESTLGISLAWTPAGGRSGGPRRR
ncbi:MAG TPA: hypothetical protein VNA89_09410 [Gemmatimonadaceae bacterium]|nr:hypothetical protein [Gemmatimonadaceae bacterium]